MGFKQTQSYQERIGKRFFKAPLKMRHIWIPLAFFLLTIYRNQAIAELSLAEAAVGLAIAIISFVPLFVWVSKFDREVPAFQCFCAVHFPFYGYPIICSKAEYMRYPEADRLYAGTTVLAFLALANLIYYFGMSRLNKSGPAKALAYREMSEKTAQTLFTMMLAGWALFTVLRQFGFLTSLGGMSNTLTAFASGGGIISLWILSRQMGEGKLSPGHKMFVLLLIFIGLGVSFATATLIGGFIMLIVAVVGYSLSCRNVPWVTILGSLFLMAFLNLGKGEIRRIHWAGGVQPFLTVSKIVDIYTTWVPSSWDALLTGRDHTGNKAQHLLDRSNLIQIHTNVVHHTPSQMPYLWGETYKYIPLNLVPRFLWKEKPHGHMASSILGLHYKVANLGSLKTTTVGFGYLSEAWANFGWIGVLGLSVVIGWTMQSVARACYGASPYSLHSLIAVVWVAWSFQIEMPISIWFSSFAQSVVAILAMCYLFSYRTARLPGGELGYSSAGAI